jgi:hypothetical protein
MMENHAKAYALWCSLSISKEGMRTLTVYRYSKIVIKAMMENHTMKIPN